jgi:hypothetical protein
MHGNRPHAGTDPDALPETVTRYLEGDFPGGAVDLRYEFVLRDHLIEHLLITP